MFNIISLIMSRVKMLLAMSLTVINDNVNSHNTSPEQFVNSFKHAKTKELPISLDSYFHKLHYNIYQKIFVLMHCKDLKVVCPITA